FLEPATSLHHLLRGDLILPEIRRGDAVLDLGEFLCGVSGVKDSSADRRPGASGPGICEAGHRVVVKALSIDSILRNVASSAAMTIASDSHATRSPIRLKIVRSLRKRTSRTITPAR